MDFVPQPRNHHGCEVLLWNQMLITARCQTLGRDCFVGKWDLQVNWCFLQASGCEMKLEAL